jgi:uncharacterized protein YndB with AHSA1/START domain
MSVKKDSSGRRWVEAEVEVPGSPEEVWDAIATGRGVASWFMPAEKREDGQVATKFGEGAEVVAKQTAWDPPRRFAAESPGCAPGAPPMATEWIVEAKGGDVCVVRVVHSLFASSDDWDDQLERFESGWPWFFRVLEIYLTHHRGEPCSAFRLVGFSTERAPIAWDRLTTQLGLAGAQVGHRMETAEDAPHLAGVTVRTGQGGHPHGLMLRLHEPAPGVASMFAQAVGGPVLLVIDLYFYGQTAAAAAAEAQPPWQAWIQRRFPPPPIPSDFSQGGQNG